MISNCITPDYAKRRKQMECPLCKGLVTSNDFKIITYNDEIEIEMTCPECGQTEVVGIESTDFA